MSIEVAAALHRAASSAGIIAQRYRMRAEAVGGLVPYASCTQGARNLATLRAAGWRLLCSPSQPKPAPGFGYAIDNGAWSLYTSGQTWNDAHTDKWLRMIDRIGSDSDWIVLPDIVCGGAASLDLSLVWLDRMRGAGTLLIAVQDGMTADQIAPILGPRVGLFVGGSTEWKERTAPAWIAIGRQAGAWVHVGRVNSGRRMKIIAGAASFDGTSATVYSDSLAPLERARRAIHRQVRMF